MDVDGFTDFLMERKIDLEKITDTVDTINDFNQFLSEKDKSIIYATYEDVYNYSTHLIEKNKNSFDNYLALVRFGHYIKNHQLLIASIEIIDGKEVLVNFSERLTKEFGDEIRNIIFKDIAFPPLGTNPQKKPEITKKLIERFLAQVDRKKCVEFLADGLRDKYREAYKKPREEFLKSKDIDEFLRLKHQNYVKTLEKHHEEGTLFYTQEVDQQVIDFVKNDQSIETGIREGNQVLIKKTPYMIKQYLNEPNEQKKRYYYCHCPWIREAFLMEDQQIPPIFCNCSAGYFKNYWEAVLDQPVKVQLLSSVLNGDENCKFAFYLPQSVLDSLA
ncbi:MAG: hypothetical protein EAX86_06500 [Candidatus Heimdallarchaeota archaeon]|nr:hypothetical protein [Candidatus Heimdallarchaeota archaeon]